MKAFLTLREYIVRDRWFLAAGFAALIIVDFLQLIVPLVIKSAIDDLTAGSYTGESLLYQALAIVAIGLLTVILRFTWRYFLIGTSRRIETGLRDRLFSHIIRLPLGALVRTRTGDLMARMTNDIDAVRMCSGIGLVALIDAFVLGSASVLFMLYINAGLTVLCLLPMLLIIVVTWRFSGLLHERFALVQAAFSQLTERVRETLAGIAVIKAFNRERDNSRLFSAASAEYIDKNLGLAKIWGTLFPFIVFASNISVCTLIFFGGRLTIVATVTPGDFVAFANYIWILIWPMMALGWIVNLFQRGAASMGRINDVLAQPVEPLGTAPPAHKFRGGIEIRGLTFSYDSAAAPALDGISMTFPPGTSIGITGTTASGKSTLCNLLLRFYEPPAGTIFLDGSDITALPLCDLRNAIAYVPQESFLFSDTIMANIRFGRPDAPPEEAEARAELSRVSAEILSFFDGFETVVGEKGITLSGGQKQRLCIARALLMNSPVLVLDDALAPLDAATAQKLTGHLEQKAGTVACTRIIVSNRIASIQQCDRIYVLDRGRIAEQGTHAELVAGQGLYHRLFARQRLEATNSFTS